MTATLDRLLTGTTVEHTGRERSALPAPPRVTCGVVGGCPPPVRQPERAVGISTGVTHRPRPADQLGAGSGATDIVLEVRPARRTGADVLVRGPTASHARRPAGRLEGSCSAGSAPELNGSAGSAV